MLSREMKEIINEDKDYYYGDLKKWIYRMLTHNPVYRRGRYIIYCRKAGFYSKHAKTLCDKLLGLYYMRRKHILGEKIGVEFGPNEFGRRLRIYHGNVVVNYAAVIGDDCELYGSNCIGNKGSFSLNTAPVLGNRVSIGVGANVIGNVRIADGVRVSSTSLVNKDLEQVNSLYGGVPAVLLKQY